MSINVLEEIKGLINSHDVVLFMKGTKSMPMCGFSGIVVHILKNYNIDFKDVNVLENSDMRQGIKDYSNWPTLPQLYIKGEFIGGADIVKEMNQSGEFEAFLLKKNLLQT